MHQNYAQRGTPAFPTTHRRYWAYLNAWDKADWRTMVWNPKGILTEAEFTELNKRRIKLSKTVGMKRSDGTIRHDLGE